MTPESAAIWNYVSRSLREETSRVPEPEHAELLARRMFHGFGMDIIDTRWSGSALELQVQIPQTPGFIHFTVNFGESLRHPDPKPRPFQDWLKETAELLADNDQRKERMAEMREYEPGEGEA